jgi:hypothetical protein
MFTSVLHVSLEFCHLQECVIKYGACSKETRSGIIVGNNSPNGRWGARWWIVSAKNSLVCCEAHPAVYAMGTGASFPEGKMAGAWRSRQSSTEVKNVWSAISLPTTPSWRVLS